MQCLFVLRKAFWLMGKSISGWSHLPALASAGVWRVRRVVSGDCDSSKPVLQELQLHRQSPHM
jgi:hypothetical protein